MLNVEVDGPIVRVELNRPEARNSFNGELILALTELFTSFTDDVRVVVLTGSGVAFSAGGDLEWMKRASGFSWEENIADAKQLARLFWSVSHCKPIVIAKVNGAAYGGGCGLVACSDYAIASDQASFGFSEVKLGLVPATIAPYVIDKIGRGWARALFTTGMSFGAEEAHRIGLVNKVAPLEALDSAVEAVIAASLMVGPEAVAQARELTFLEDLSEDAMAERIASARASEEGKEGIAAFLEKRKPSFAVKRS